MPQPTTRARLPLLFEGAGLDIVRRVGASGYRPHHILRLINRNACAHRHIVSCKSRAAHCGEQAGGRWRLVTPSALFFLAVLRYNSVRMQGHILRKKFLDFFASKGHAVIPSASIVPENDPTVLFTTAGMHPLVPYLLGEPHPAGRRLAGSQKCLRTDDIDEVGDAVHLTFFEMLGNWSLGDYWKEDTITWSYEFLTDKKWLGLDPKRLQATVFEGDADAPYDKESAAVWKRLGLPVTPYGKDKNWWGPAGQTGPCGPDTEIFYDIGRFHGLDHGTACHPNCACGRYVEIWNNVFMQYHKTKDGRYEPLAQKNVDTGLGFERVAAVMQGVDDIYQSDLFSPLVKKIEDVSGKRYGESEATTRRMRIIADHLRAATFVLGDPWGVSPSNKDQGYVVRRLIRRAIVQAWLLDVFHDFTTGIAEVVITTYGDAYPELRTNQKKILDDLGGEEQRFRATLAKGIAAVDDIVASGQQEVTGSRAFELYATYGFPVELLKEVLGTKSAATVAVDEEGYHREFLKHQDISRAGSAQKFSGGLADHSAEVIRGHTATHLLHKALLTVLGPQAVQKGSNITAERLRFDFTWPRKLTPEEQKTIQSVVNEQITRDMPVHFEVLDREEAKRVGAIGLFDETYAALGGKIKVYFIGEGSRGYYSTEICGGPHVSRTGELGTFTIIKEEAVSAGIRRIKARVSGRQG